MRNKRHTTSTSFARGAEGIIDMANVMTGKIKGATRCKPGAPCALLDTVIKETERKAKRGNGAGLGIGVRLSPKKGEAACVVVYCTGRAARDAAQNFVCNFCPFCGKKTR